MKILIVEDDMVSRKMLKKYMKNFGCCDVAVNGLEALEAFLSAHQENEPYELICLDIMMPKLDGTQVLKAIRDYEEQKAIDLSQRVKIIMTTAINDKDTVMESYEMGCEAYAWKPLDLEKIREVMISLKLVDA